MIARNTTIPTSKSETFSTAMDNQPSVEIHVLQGEREMAVDNKSLWRFMLDSLAPAPRWVPQIEVTFDIDANWVLTVKAKDKGTWKEQKVVIQGSTGMDSQEVDRLVKEAEAKREEDKKKKDLIESKNLADSTIYQSEKTIADNKDKISKEIIDEVEVSLNNLKEIKESGTKEDIDLKVKDLNDKLMKIWQEIYWKQNQESKVNEDWTIDAEIEQ